MSMVIVNLPSSSDLLNSLLKMALLSRLPHFRHLGRVQRLVHGLVVGPLQI